jgi:hypothetical protein
MTTTVERPLLAGLKALTNRKGRHDNAGPLRDWLLPVSIRLGQAAVQLLFIGWMRGWYWGRTGQVLTIWDAQLYARVIKHGYPSSITVHRGTLTSGTEFAFPPIYPALCWALTRLGFTVQASEITVAMIGAVALSVVAYRLALLLYDTRRTAVIASVLIGALPMSVVLQMGYAESVFAALAAGATLCAFRGRWGFAAVLAFIAGLTRPIGYIASIPLLFIAWRRSSQITSEAARAERMRGVAASAAGLSSTAVYLIFIAIRSGKINGWFTVEERGWGTHFDGGRSFVHFASSVLHDPSRLGAPAFPVLAIMVGFVLVVVILATRESLPFFAIGAATLITVFGSTNFWHSRPRLLLAAAILVVPMAGLLNRVNSRALAPLLGTACLASFWFGAYMVTTWPYAI